MTGFEELTIVCIKAEQESKSSLKKLSPLSSLSLASVISFRSWPALKTLPLAAITITFIDLSSQADEIAFIKAKIILFESAFLLL